MFFFARETEESRRGRDLAALALSQATSHRERVSWGRQDPPDFYYFGVFLGGRLVIFRFYVGFLGLIFDLVTFIRADSRS